MAGAADLFAAALRHEDEGRPEEALGCYRTLLGAAPHHADARHNHGLLLARLGRLDEAEQSHRGYTAAVPSDSRAHSDLADVLLALGRYEETLDAARTAIKLDARSFLPYFTAGLAASMLMQFAHAREWFGRAQQADPAGFARFLRLHEVAGALDRDIDPRAVYLIREFENLEQCDWRNRERYVGTFQALVEADEPGNRVLDAPPLMFRALTLPLSLQVRRRLADNIARRFASGAASLRLAAPATLVSGNRIRLGYVSPDFRTHPTGILAAPLFRLHDRSRFEVHAFSLGGKDDSPLHRQIRDNADVLHELVGLSLQGVLSRVRAAGVDLLVDLAGITSGALPELFAARAAPVQISYLGFPGTSGAGLVDYLICDEVCVPECESAAYSETLVRLPGTFWICEPPPSAPQLPTRAVHGLPEGAVVLYAHHPGRKIYPEVFAAWMSALKAAPICVLWLLEESPILRRNLIREAERHGISAGRLVFSPRVPYAEYLARIPLADLALDTPIYNGGATTLDALATGIPVLACSAAGFAGRMAASALHAAGLGDLVFPDLAAYAKAIVELAGDSSRRARLAARVRGARSTPLFDAETRVRELESAYARMYARAAKSRPTS